MKFISGTLRLPLIFPATRRWLQTSSASAKTSAMAYTKELKIAELAVQRAAILTSSVAKTLLKESAESTVIKSDASPVTVGDFGAQAVILSALRKNFPNDEFVGEEDASELRSNGEVMERVLEVVRATCGASEAGIVSEIGTLTDPKDICDAIDLGNSSGGAKGRIWALDPIDGTKGFLRGDQYAVCLALLVDGSPVLGVIGCPNLPINPENPELGKGVLFCGVKGQGSYTKPLFADLGSAVASAISFNHVTDVKKARICEGVEAAHSAHDLQKEITILLGINRDPVRMDSQAKYCSISRGDGDIYLRLPRTLAYQEKIWDHAAGNVLVTEAGGVVTDIFGHPLDFSVGRTLKKNKGVIAAGREIHGAVMEAVKKVTEGRIPEGK